jgi:hypothetical protein
MSVTPETTSSHKITRRESVFSFNNGCGGTPCENVFGKKGKCSRNWFYVPWINIFIEYFSVMDPPTPDELTQSLEVTGLVAALFIAMLAAATQSYGFDDFDAAFTRLGINQTNGQNFFIDGVDPYSFWVNSTCEAFNAFSCTLLITGLTIFHQSSVDFTIDGEYSVKLRQAWWAFGRVPMCMNFGFLAYALYKSTEAYQMLAMMMLPNPGGTTMPDGPQQLVIGAIFDPDWKDTYKYNFAAIFLYSLGWYFGMFGIIGTFSLFSCALANKHRRRTQLLTQKKEITRCRKCCVLNPGDASGFNNLGVALMQHGKEMDDICLLKQAEQSFRTSVDISGATSPSTSKNLRWIEEYLTDCDAITSTTPPKIEQNDRDTPLEDTVRELAAMQVRILELMTNMQKTSSAAALD